MLHFPTPLVTMNIEVPPVPKRRKKSELEGNYTSFETGNCQLDIINNLVRSINKLTQSVYSMNAKEHSCWNLIEEVPNLDKWAHYKALKLLNATVRKVEFPKMTPKEHHEWITYELGQ